MKEGYDDRGDRRKTQESPPRPPSSDTTDPLLALELATAGAGMPERWLPSAFAPKTYRLVGGQCVRVVEGALQQVVLEIAAPVRPERPACHAACCSAAQRAPAPDGSIECCLCKDLD
jgi:hypothetical protein